jgi:membrane dipeptidase
MADHVEYFIERAGPDHVGIGLDYGFPVDGDDDIDAIVRAHPEYWPTDRYSGAKVEFMPPSGLRAMAQALLDRGHSERVVRGVLGENFARVAEQVW